MSIANIPLVEYTRLLIRVTQYLKACDAIHQKMSHKLDRTYVCMQCRSVFLFKDEVENHKLITGHTDSISSTLDSWE